MLNWSDVDLQTPVIRRQNKGIPDIIAADGTSESMEFSLLKPVIEFI